MKTINCKYKSITDLNLFITSHKELISSKSILIQIFSGILDKDLLEKISTSILNILPNSNIIGATTDGEIIDDSVTTNSIIISFSTFEKSTIKSCVIQTDDVSLSYNMGIDIASALKVENTKAMILFADGLNVNGEELLNGVSTVSEDIIISGGLAGDNATFKSTYIIHQNKVYQKGVVGISINSDDLVAKSNYSFAWKTIGKGFVVNKSIKNVVYEIDGMNPSKLYEKYLGKNISDLLPGIGIEFPLIIQDNGLQIARAVLSKNDDGSLIFAGNIKEGSIVKFGVGDANELINDTLQLSQKISTESSESMFIYSCMARRHFLDTNASNDIKYFSKIANVSGFFTYGEFYTTKNKHVRLLNESLTILSLSENNNKKVVYLDIHEDTSSNFTTLQALSHLINVSSSELESLNENLENKISVEIHKNLENEKKIFNSMKMSSLGDMIANIAHQWRQPLSVISTLASGLQVQRELDILSDEKFYKNMDMIIKQSEYLSDTIDIFRNFIQDDYVLSETDLHQDIDKTLKIIDVVLKDNNIELINNINYDRKINLKLISGELSQVVINIFNNAKDALILKNIKDKKIIINTILNDGFCTITIEDNAGGIKEEIIPKIFEPYFTTKHKNNGTGIGLYMSYDIVTKHFGGDLYANNTNDGAKFYIKIPLHASSTK